MLVFQLLCEYYTLQVLGSILLGLALPAFSYGWRKRLSQATDNHSFKIENQKLGINQIKFTNVNGTSRERERENTIRNTSVYTTNLVITVWIYRRIISYYEKGEFKSFIIILQLKLFVQISSKSENANMIFSDPKRILLILLKTLRDILGSPSSLRMLCVQRLVMFNEYWPSYYINLLIAPSRLIWLSIYVLN